MLKELQKVCIEIDQVKSKLKKFEFDKKYGIPIWYPDRQDLISNLISIIDGGATNWNITMRDFELERIRHFAEYLITVMNSNNEREKITTELGRLKEQEMYLKRDLEIG